MFLENAQQVGLRFQVDVANLVEENRSAFGDLKFSFLAVLRSGEGAFFVSEEFALEQRFGQGAAVDYDQRVEAARDWHGGWRARPVLCRCRFLR